MSEDMFSDCGSYISNVSNDKYTDVTVDGQMIIVAFTSLSRFMITSHIETM